MFEILRSRLKDIWVDFNQNLRSDLKEIWVDFNENLRSKLKEIWIDFVRNFEVGAKGEFGSILSKFRGQG